MKIVVGTFVLILLLAIQSKAFQVTSPKLIFEDAGSNIKTIQGGQFSDTFLSPCRRNSSNGQQPTSPLYIKQADGTYQLLLLPDIQGCTNGQQYVATNGKWIYVHGYNSSNYFNPTFFAFYSLDDESNPNLVTITYDESLTYPEYALFNDEDSFVGAYYSSPVRSYTWVEMQYQNGHWNITSMKPLSDFDFKNVSSLTSTSLPVSDSVVQRFVEPVPTIFSKQQDGEWVTSTRLNKKKHVESFEMFTQETIPHFNGNDTIIYFGNTRYEWSSGTIYIAEYQKNSSTWNVVKKFYPEDAGLELEYMNILFSWGNAATWINQDMAFLMVPNFPLAYNGTDYPYGGSVVMIYRNSTGEWHMGGRISLDNDGTGEAVRLNTMTRTASDIIIVGNVGFDFGSPKKYFLYSYPLCFPQPLNVTCFQDVVVASCNETDPNLLTGAYEYDDSCGEPMVTIESFVVSNYTATVELQFERLGFNVGQCTTTLVCPKPPPVAAPTEAVSAADRVVLNLISLVTFLLVLVSIVQY